MTWIGIAATLIVALSSVADHRRGKRRDLDAVGIMPWPLISIIGTIVALFAFALAIKASL